MRGVPTPFGANQRGHCYVCLRKAASGQDATFFCLSSFSRGCLS
jgi:hypothetical protein